MENFIFERPGMIDFRFPGELIAEVTNNIEDVNIKLFKTINYNYVLRIEDLSQPKIPARVKMFSSISSLVSYFTDQICDDFYINEIHKNLLKQAALKDQDFIDSWTMEV